MAKTKPVITIYQTGEFPNKANLNNYAQVRTGEYFRWENKWFGYFLELTGHGKKAEAKEYALATCKDTHLVEIRGEGTFYTAPDEFKKNKIWGIRVIELSGLDLLIEDMYRFLRVYANEYALDLKASFVDKTELGKLDRFRIYRR